MGAASSQIPQGPSSLPSGSAAFLPNPAGPRSQRGFHAPEKETRGACRTPTDHSLGSTHRHTKGGLIRNGSRPLAIVFAELGSASGSSPGTRQMRAHRWQMAGSGGRRRRWSCGSRSRSPSPRPASPCPHPGPVRVSERGRREEGGLTIPGGCARSGCARGARCWRGRGRRRGSPSPPHPSTCNSQPSPRPPYPRNSPLLSSAHKPSWMLPQASGGGLEKFPDLIPASALPTRDKSRFDRRRLPRDTWRTWISA